MRRWYLEQFSGVLGTETVDEVAQFVNASFADVFQVLSKAELYPFLNTWVLAVVHVSQRQQ